MPRIKTTQIKVSTPNYVLSWMDQVCASYGMSRSQLVNLALAQIMNGLPGEEPNSQVRVVRSVEVPSTEGSVKSHDGPVHTFMQQRLKVS